MVNRAALTRRMELTKNSYFGSGTMTNALKFGTPALHADRDFGHTNALNPLTARPTTSVLISLVPS